ncbi:PRC-barrel domain-containing protein [Teichococcus vastitatis]|uniref:PRC-barrel domain-containing protein n=1 Tax=Teichococcus vastitatis TaxID=2307076 RepID=A0ABS9W7E3_9PROT|nr:PRC-barrel domain-containing protein [Pseudoroseomonas vastitatis]MCI0755217.1 PRC-barrel domain-containing protein [Pseudoroseomonas vastitatis]
MKLRPILAAGLALSLGLAALPATAQAPAAQPTQIEAGQTRAKMLLDRDVYSSDDVEIGEVEDLILNAQQQVVLAVIEIESRLGFTEKYVAVPLAQLTPSASNNDRVTLAMTRDQVRDLPGFRYQD